MLFFVQFIGATMRVDINHLREVTAAAIAEGERRRHEIVVAEAEGKRRKEMQAKLKAGLILAQVPHRAKTEARAGRNFAIVMSIKHSDYTQPHENYDYNSCYPVWLTGAARIVFDRCNEIGLRPTIEFWHDGVGVESGFNIVIHWK